MKLYFDTSAIAKLFFDEIGSAAVIQLVQSENCEIWISHLAHMELHSALQRRAREQRYSEEEYNTVSSHISEQLAIWNTAPLTTETMSEAIELMKAHGKSHYLRTLDALQLATFKLMAENDESPLLQWQFVCCDKALVKVAQLLGFATIFPE
jgi:uncharacterized protein